MTLARIITRSQACSRELALDLLARGYAVEIVSPDKVPDNIADLELRVDIGPGDQLVANVEAHDGERTASLEFVRDLKVPMVNIACRPPDVGEANSSSGERGDFKVTPGIGDAELIAGAPQVASRAASRALEILLNRELDFGINLEEDPRQIAPQALSRRPVKSLEYLATEDAAVPLPAIVLHTRAGQLHSRSARWPRRAALILVSLVLLAVVLGFSMRRTSKGAARSSEVLPVDEMSTASTGVNLLSAVGAGKDPGRDPRQVSALSLPPVAADSQGNYSHPPSGAQVAKVRVPLARSQIMVSRDDLIARDTVTYLDKRYEPTPKAKPAKPRLHGGTRSHSTHGGGIAANAATALHSKPATNGTK
jgi:hypothetical protein